MYVYSNRGKAKERTKRLSLRDLESMFKLTIIVHEKEFEYENRYTNEERLKIAWS